ncbi:hypothetical protein GJ496_006628 [Pomphorhynchus laevis]|nr:hypothetical protein GJ496_006628 [Pomphorhynchus laevis]
MDTIRRVLFNIHSSGLHDNNPDESPVDNSNSDQHTINKFIIEIPIVAAQSVDNILTVKDLLLYDSNRIYRTSFQDTWHANWYIDEPSHECVLSIKPVSDTNLNVLVRTRYGTQLIKWPIQCNQNEFATLRDVVCHVTGGEKYTLHPSLSIRTPGLLVNFDQKFYSDYLQFGIIYQKPGQNFSTNLDTFESDLNAIDTFAAGIPYRLEPTNLALRALKNERNLLYCNLPDKFDNVPILMHFSTVVELFKEKQLLDSLYSEENLYSDLNEIISRGAQNRKKSVMKTVLKAIEFEDMMELVSKLSLATGTEEIEVVKNILGIKNVTENEIFGNCIESASFQEFLLLLGKRIPVEDLNGYFGGKLLNYTGRELLFRKYHNFEIIFHVSTMLPYSIADKQQIERKRYIGNDIFAIVFQDEETEFSPEWVTSKCLSGYVIIAQIKCEEETVNRRYKVSVTMRNGISVFPPSIPYSSQFAADSAFGEWVIQKLICGQVAAFTSPYFTNLLHKTRKTELSYLISELNKRNDNKMPLRVPIHRNLLCCSIRKSPTNLFKSVHVLPNVVKQRSKSHCKQKKFKGLNNHVGFTQLNDHCKQKSNSTTKLSET